MSLTLPTWIAAIATAVLAVGVIVAAGLARDDYLSPFYLQYSSQWDGLRHIESGGRFYNGISPEQVDDPEEPSDERLGVVEDLRNGVRVGGHAHEACSES